MNKGYVEDFANRDWATDTKSDAWWREAAKAKRIEFGLNDKPRVGISTAHIHHPIMFQRTYDWNRHD